MFLPGFSKGDLPKVVQVYGGSGNWMRLRFPASSLINQLYIRSMVAADSTETGLLK